MPTPTPQDHAFLTRVFALAQRSRAEGHHPFAAIVVGADGTVIAEAMNDSSTDRTAHAEMNALRAATARPLWPAPRCTAMPNLARRRARMPEVRGRLRVAGAMQDQASRPSQVVSVFMLTTAAPASTVPAIHMNHVSQQARDKAEARVSAQRKVA
jgi:pyrimidine deaminase RibD-like protein